MMLTPAAKQAATAGRGWAPKSPAAAACSIGFASGGSGNCCCDCRRNLSGFLLLRFAYFCLSFSLSSTQQIKPGGEQVGGRNKRTKKKEEGNNDSKKTRGGNGVLSSFFFYSLVMWFGAF
jgi:hypothetical protein